jgi:ADP-ribose pyrophosphatase YjhB (NUDIX family)
MTATDPLDLVRIFFRAVNRGDLDAIVALYHPHCIVEHVFTGDGAVYEGRDTVRRRWAAEFERYAGALENRGRVAVAQVAGMEAGWGWVRADWSSVLSDAAGRRNVETEGYSHFWFDDGLIRRHRNVSREARRAARPGGGGTAPLIRQYPTTPVVGIGAVVLDDRRRVVLVKRRYEPLAGQWSLPGGALELGETLEAGAAREIREETGLVVDVGPVVEVFDRILLDEAGKIRYHFVLVDYLCAITGGSLQAGSDVEDVHLADADDLGPLRVAAKARDVVAKALAMKP